MRENVVIKGKPQRVLQVFSSLNRGGAESRMMDIYRNIEKEQVQFDFAVTSENVEPVSYTHLDVYKRQTCIRP